MSNGIVRGETTIIIPYTAVEIMDGVQRRLARFVTDQYVNVTGFLTEDDMVDEIEDIREREEVEEFGCFIGGAGN